MVIGHRLADDPLALTGLERREPVLAQETYIRSLESYLDMDLAPAERNLVNSRLSGAIFKLARVEARIGPGRAWQTLARSARVHPNPLKGGLKAVAAAMFGEWGFALLLDRRLVIDRS